MKKIFEAVELKNLTVRNRLVRSATWEGIANPDGSVTEEAYDIYSELAKGGVGAIITGFTSVDLHDCYFDGMMRLCDDALIPQYRKLVDVIHAEGCPVITQLALGAYYREVNGRYRRVEPDEMTANEIHRVIRQFVDAAVRAEKREQPLLMFTRESGRGRCGLPAGRRIDAPLDGETGGHGADGRCAGEISVSPAHRGYRPAGRA